MAFKECKNKEDAFKLRLVYFAEAVLIRAKANITVNLDNLYLVEDMDSGEDGAEDSQNKGGREREVWRESA
ncbi:hypothetical protein D8674_003675 [Pyrus ussuriensis x Pyrus communis]|uniref:Uncharacterized protein n=1 Tax=Pyrus ussuriensis x Pyrus communis TaxID=2448454 RepID=A0A5N5FMZ9_9ROSA|nr:hypothetical protein D8674_003675 [Pyrus ussuriensis x Pyrus communis]